MSESRVPTITSKRAKAPAAAQPVAKEVRWFRVTSETRQVPRDHGDYVLKRGKEISSASFDIQKLRNIGVTLEEIPTPGWYIEAQRKGQDLAEQLASEGVDVEVPPAYVAPEVKPPATAA